MHSNQAPTTLVESLRAFGITDEYVRYLNTGNDDFRTQIEYRDLLEGPGTAREIEAVVEVGNYPVLYILSQDRLAAEPEQQARQVKSLVDRLTCRGYASYLAVMGQGRLTFYTCQLKTTLDMGAVLERSNPAALGQIQDLLLGTEPVQIDGQTLQPAHGEVHAVLMKLLTQVNQTFEQKAKVIHPRERLALIGRALFARFLADRNILNEHTASPIFDLIPDIEMGFDSPQAAAAVCEWLDDTFNGELLPLPKQGLPPYRNYFQQLERHHPGVLRALGWIMRHDASGQTPLWKYINFAHVPVGLLSEIYEDFAHKHFKDQALKDSVRYTPRHLAETLVDQAFSSFAPDRVADIVILDPAAGAGVFLVLCLKRLVLERWRKDMVRPDSAVIRQILYEQVRGFDISESALLLSALSLYLTAIELDPQPFPPEKLKFETNLIDSVLFSVGEVEDAPLGTLGPLVGPEHEQVYDLVIGNPPWTSWEGPKGPVRNREVSRLVQQVAEARMAQTDDVAIRNRIGSHLPYKNPDNVPDLPFVWKSMQLCKKDGKIALILHARLLFGQTPIKRAARNLLFSSLRITGILNGASLADGGLIWPKMKAQFCLLFANNRVPHASEAFSFVSPPEEPGLSRQGRLRIDAFQTQTISFQSVLDRPTLLKNLARGTVLDVDVMEYLEAKVITGDAEPLGLYWTTTLNLKSGDGYEVGGTPQKSTQHLIELKGKDLGPLKEKDPYTGKSRPKQLKYLIRQDDLPAFNQTSLFRPRAADIFRPPIVMLREAMRAERNEPHAHLVCAGDPVFYTDSIIGFSAHGHVEADLLSRYLFLIYNSSLFTYYQLMISAKFGIERRGIHKVDADAFPVVALSTLDKDTPTRALILTLSQALLDDNTVDWQALDDFVFGLYGLKKRHIQVIKDTLDVGLPTAEALATGERAPTVAEVEQFCALVERNLAPILQLAGHEIRVAPAETASAGRTWKYIDVVDQKIHQDVQEPTFEVQMQLITQLVQNTGTSFIVMPIDAGHFRFGLLGKYRYWTPSRSRLFAHEVLLAWDQAHPVAQVPQPRSVQGVR